MLRTPKWWLLGAFVLPMGHVSAQLPDVLHPNGHLDGIFRLVDRNGDGDYLDDGEVYDYVLDGVDSSPRTVAFRPGAIGRLYWCDEKRDGIFWGEDTNADGFIDVTEQHTFVDLSTATWGGNTAPHWITIDNSIAPGSGVVWWCIEVGGLEGVWSSRDLNNDGDAEDAGETLSAAIETGAPYSVGNLTVAATVDFDNIDSIEFDSAVGSFGGRFLVEEEDVDQTLALEDMDGDGKFSSAGEVYLFCALYNGGTLVADVHPDVISGLLPSSNEIAAYAVDDNVFPPKYYLLSKETNNAQLDAAIVYLGQDLNMDKDINDPGEVTVFWDGSLDSLGATFEYNFCYGIDVDAAGNVYIAAEWEGVSPAPDHERILLLNDNNPANGNANDPGETVMLFEWTNDQAAYDITVVPAGMLALPNGLPATYSYYGAATCPSSLPGFHNVAVGTDRLSDKAVVGNQLFSMRTWGANPSSPGVITMGYSNTLFSGLVPLPLPFNPSCTLYADFALQLSVTTDIGGQAVLVIPIPADSVFIGVETYWTSAVIDLAQPLAFTLADGVYVRMGTYSFSKERGYG